MATARAPLGPVAWVAAVVAAEILLVRGAWTLGRGVGGTWQPALDQLGLSSRPFERFGAGVCGTPLGRFDTFWLRHGDAVQAWAGAVVVLAAILVFVAAAVRWRRVAAVALVVGIVLLVLVRVASHHAHDAFWHDTSPAVSGWSDCGDDDSSA